MTFNTLIRAARLRTLPLSVSGILVGTGLAIREDRFQGLIFALALITTIGFQVVSNFANDYGDGVKGTDNKDRVGPQRAVQSGAISASAMKRVVIITSLFTFLMALLLVLVSFGLNDVQNIAVFIGLGLLSIWAAIKYTVGKSAYGYSGLGDIFVFAFFGLLSVCGSAYLYTHQFNWTFLLPAFSIGALSVAVLNLNNMRDRESDITAGKNTLVVKIGAEASKYYHYYLVISSLLFSVLYLVIEAQSLFDITVLLAYFPLGIHLVRVHKIADDKNLDPELKVVALSTFLYSILFLVTSWVL